MDMKSKSFGMIALVLMLVVILFPLSTPAYATDQETNLDIRPMVFVHGFSGSGSQFESQALRFTSNGYPANYIATYEYNSYALSRNASVISQVLAGLDNFIDALRNQTGFAQVDLLGHSMGTMVCQQYLNSSSSRAAKVAHYVNIDGARATALPGSAVGHPVPTLAIWAGAGWTYNASNTIVGATNVRIPNTTHVQVCTCAESFAYMYEFFTGKEPVTTDILPQLTSQVVLAGRVLYFPYNTPGQNATLEIWEVNGKTGARIGSSPQATYYLPLGGNGTWGPFNAKGGAYYEFAFTYYSTFLRMIMTIHYYYQPFIRNDYWIRLLCDPPSGGVGLYMDFSSSPTHSNLIIIRYKEFWGDQGANNDILEINGVNVVNAATCPMNKTGAVNAIYAFDNGNDGISHINTPVAFYYGLPFMTGVDLYIPAATPPNWKISLVLAPRGGGGETQVINVPNWASSNNTIIVQFNDYLQVDWWPMFHHDMSHSGYSTSTGPKTNQTLWNYTTGGWVESSPAVVNGVVYVGSDDDNVYALNATSGAMVWKYTTGGWVRSSPAVVNGVVFVGSYDNHVYALNATTGKQVWNYTTGAGVRSSPAVVNGVVFVGSLANNRVYALDAATGKQVWNYTTGGGGDSSPAVVNGVVFVGSYDNHVYALNATTGKQVWNYTTGGGVGSSPAVASGVVYVGSMGSRVYALNAATGKQVWNYTTGGSVESSPAVANGIVYVGSYDNHVYALNATTGKQVWNYTTGDAVAWSSPAVASGVVYVGSDDDRVYALDAATGKQVWNYTTGDQVKSPPAVANGVVYVGSHDNRVYAFGTLYHDVAVTMVTPCKTVVGKGYSVEINVAAPNQGNYTETFNVTIYANTVPITSQKITLLIGSCGIISLFWNTTGYAYGNYTLRAYAWPVPSEINTANNNFTGGLVKVTIPGDVNGDRRVTWDDLSDLGLAYGSKPGDLYWNPNADIDGNGKVNWDDLSTLGLNYGKSW